MYDIHFTKTFRDYGLPSAGDFPQYARAKEPPVLVKAGSLLAAHKQVADVLMGSRHRIEIKTPVGPVIVDRALLWHIVENRSSVRERFANFIRPTLESPNEVWLQYYPKQGVYRKRFIKLFKASNKKRNFLVITQENKDGSVLWNAFPAKTKYIDDQRTGVFLFGRRG